MSGWPRYEKRQRIATKDGIKARTQTFGQAWWSRKWIAALEGLGWDARLGRGRSYARSGQVLDYTVAAGRVTAKVQGSRPKPYKIDIALAPISDREWEKVLDALAARAEYVARLLNGDMPQDIDEAFAEAGAALLPRTSSELQNTCSCPDWGNPCKHIAAVYYVIGEALDSDPFILTTLRGRDRETLLGALRARRGDEPMAVVPEETNEALSLEGFWQGGAVELDPDLSPPRVRASVLRRLGVPGAWTTVDEMQAVFANVLAAASEAALAES
ncbi:MAG: metal-binding protein [Proteobacteria bacterium]|nr:metal-binding protein [Pseudomonadota bacterium]